jgi:hypothetical protein
MKLTIPDSGSTDRCWVARCNATTDIIRGPNGHDFEYDGDIGLCDPHNAAYCDLQDEELEDD